MPRYHFNYRYDTVLEDATGEDLPNIDAARGHARRVALELARGGAAAPASVVVTGAKGQTLFTIDLFTERP